MVLAHELTHGFDNVGESVFKKLRKHKLLNIPDFAGINYPDFD